MGKNFDFSGRKVLLTGATRGIGRKMAGKLVARGAHVLAVARDAALLEKLERKYPGAVTAHRADLAAADDVRSLADWVGAEHRDCSVLINNAAIMNHFELTTLFETRFEEIAREIRINLTAPLQLAVELLPVLGAQSSAAIVNVTTGLAIAPKRSAAVYCATKAGLRSFTRSLRDQCRHEALPVLVSDAIMTLVDTELSSAAARKYPPDRAAEDVLAGIERGRDEIWVEKTKLLRVVHRISPSLAYRIMRDR